MEDIITLETIVSVWENINSPDAATAYTSVPVTQLPKISLTDADEDGRYEGNYSGFTTPGKYGITVFAEDFRRWGSLPVAVTVTKQ